MVDAELFTRAVGMPPFDLGPARVFNPREEAHSKENPIATDLLDRRRAKCSDEYDEGRWTMAPGPPATVR